MTTTVYATRLELRSRISPSRTEEWNPSEDATHDAVLEAFSREVDAFCNDFFGSYTGAYVFTAERSDRLVVPSLVSVSALVTDETTSGTYGRTWASTDYYLWPFNAATSYPAQPYLEIRQDVRTISAGYSFPTAPRAVQVTGTWGWPSVPAPVKEVTLLESQRWLKQIESPMGIVSNEAGEATAVPNLHPTSRLMLRRYIRTAGAVAVSWPVVAMGAAGIVSLETVAGPWA